MAGLILLILRGLQILIFVDVILSWVIRDESQFPRNITRQITQPLYAPIHKILNPQAMGGLDISPIILFMILRGMETMIVGGLR